MATQTWSTIIDHNSDASFRVWGLETQTKFLAVGLTQTADTGQVNWASVTRPAVNLSPAYEIYRFNDPMQATAPVFIRFEYGTALVANYPGMWVSVGTGTNGAGTLTGVILARTMFSVNISGQAPSSIVNYVSQLCLLDGYLMFIWKRAARSSPNAYGFLSISRTADAAGVVDGRGLCIYRHYPTANTVGPLVTSYGYAKAAAIVTDTEQFSAVPFDLTATLIGGVTPQVFKNYIQVPLVLTHPFHLTYINLEMPEYSTFQANVVGVTRTFQCLGDAERFIGSVRDTDHSLAVVFE